MGVATSLLGSSLHADDYSEGLRQTGEIRCETGLWHDPVLRHVGPGASFVTSGYTTRSKTYESDVLTFVDRPHGIVPPGAEIRRGVLIWN
jgi:hypothetical protein